MAAQDQTFWKAALAGAKPSVTDGKPEYGFYRQKYTTRKNEEIDNPVAVWLGDDGKWVAKRSHQLIENTERDPDAVFKLFLSSCQKPVKFAHYESALRGDGWPNDIGPDAKAPPAKGSVPGDNAPPEDEAPQSDDPLAELKRQLDAAWAELAEWLKTLIDDEKTTDPKRPVYKITDKDQADKAANYKARFGELEAEIEKARKIAKEPHLKAGKEVDATYGKVRDSAQGSKIRMAEIIKPYDDEQRRIRAEAARIANEAAQAAGVQGESFQPTRTSYGGDNGRRVAPREIKCVRIIDVALVQKAFMATERFKQAAEDWAMSVGPLADPAIPGTEKFTDTKIT